MDDGAEWGEKKAAALDIQVQREHLARVERVERDMAIKRGGGREGGRAR
jgi:hypothetical protein